MKLFKITNNKRKQIDIELFKCFPLIIMTHNILITRDGEIYTWWKWGNIYMVIYTMFKHRFIHSIKNVMFKY